MQQKTLLRQLRRVREISLDELAAATGINVSTLSRGERGLMKMTPEQRQILEQYFGKSWDELMSPAIAKAEVA